MNDAQTGTSAQRYTSLRAFYPYYLTEHANITCRRFHFAGTTLLLFFIGLTLYTRNLTWLWAVPVSGYGGAWIGHFFFEHNRPATFKYPFYSFVSDFIMYGQMLTGKVKIR